MMDWQVANTVMTSDTFCSTYCKGCGPSVTPASRWTPALRDDCVRAIETIANTSARGQISQSHAMGPMEDVAQREWGVACFLIGAGKLSFYSYANWAKDSWTTAVRPALPASLACMPAAAFDVSCLCHCLPEAAGRAQQGTRWWPEYARKIGAPLDAPLTKAASSGHVYTRRFSSGTTVRVDIDKHEAKIVWA